MLFEDMGGYGDIENPGDIPVWKISLLKLNLPLSFFFPSMLDFIFFIFCPCQKLWMEIEASCTGVG